MVNKIAEWTRSREGVPFDAADHNKIINFLNGYLAAPFRLVQVSGSMALLWEPSLDLFTFGASINLGATTTLKNTIWLDGYRSDNTTPVHLVRVNSSNVIQFAANGETTELRGTLFPPHIDPPTGDGQLTTRAVCKGFYSGYISGGSLGDGRTYNVSAAVRNSDGDYTITWDRAFADDFYAVNLTVEASTRLMCRVHGKSDTEVDIRIETTAGVNTDPAAFHLVAFGELV